MKFAVEGPSIRHIVFPIITGSYLGRRRRLTVLDPGDTKLASHLTLLMPDEKFLQKHILKRYFTKFGYLFKAQSMT